MRILNLSEQAIFHYLSRLSPFSVLYRIQETLGRTSLCGIERSSNDRLLGVSIGSLDTNCIGHAQGVRGQANVIDQSLAEIGRCNLRRVIGGRNLDVRPSRNSIIELGRNVGHLLRQFLARDACIDHGLCKLQAVDVGRLGLTASLPLDTKHCLRQLLTELRNEPSGKALGERLCELRADHRQHCLDRRVEVADASGDPECVPLACACLKERLV